MPLAFRPFPFRLLPLVLLPFALLPCSSFDSSIAAAQSASAPQASQGPGARDPRTATQAADPEALEDAAESTTDPTHFTDPLMPVGPDPWVVAYKGYYYYTRSTGNNLRLWKTRDITDLRHAERRVVWTPPAGTPYSAQVWAPELHRLDNAWYLYFAADDGQNHHHHIFVLENTSDDPEQGEWTLKGMVSDPSLRWAIDPTVLELPGSSGQPGKRYLLWSGWPGKKNKVQDLYIAELSNPWTIQGKRHLLSKPELPWEKQIGTNPAQGEIPQQGVNEGPEILQHGPSTFLVYSASGCWTDSYALGMLTLAPGKNPVKRSSWIKSPSPLLSTDPASPAYGPGHNSFFLSPDGKQNWIIYHANPQPGEGCGNRRSPRIQPFTFDTVTGAPILGQPVPLDLPMPKPSGTAVAAEKPTE